MNNYEIKIYHKGDLVWESFVNAETPMIALWELLRFMSNEVAMIKADELTIDIKVVLPTKGTAL